MLTKLLSIVLTLALAAACSSGGAPPTPQPPRPQPVVTERGPCLTRPMPMPPAELIALADVGDLTPEQEAWLWTYIEVLEGYADRAWRVCGRPAALQ
jgi:hypothetical protein